MRNIICLIALLVLLQIQKFLIQLTAKPLANKVEDSNQKELGEKMRPYSIDLRKAALQLKQQGKT